MGDDAARDRRGDQPGPGIVEGCRQLIRWIREHPLAADAFLAVALTALALVIHAGAPLSGPSTPARDQSWWTALLVIAACLPITFRRVRPVLTLVVVVAAQMACEVLHIAGPSWLAVLVAIYSLGAHTDGRRRIVATAGVGVPVATLLVVGVLEDEVEWVDAVASIGLFMAAFVLGDNLRRRRLHVESLADRAERAERERDLLARERVTEERNRIARELHDIVAHSVSVMVIQAAAARRNVDSRPEAAKSLLENIEHTGRQTMDELRQVLGVLRGAEGQRLAMPLPSLSDVEALVDAGGGPPVRLSVTGLVDVVPAGVGLSAYRVVQEALTNCTRHAGPGVSVDVRITCAADRVAVCVEDDGRGASSTPSIDGYGLTGMHERVSAAGGTFTAGPRAGGGWRVNAVIPFPAAASTAELAS